MTGLLTWEEALKAANEQSVGSPEPPADDPVTPLVRAWLTTGRGSAGYERNWGRHGFRPAETWYPVPGVES